MANYCLNNIFNYHQLSMKYFRFIYGIFVWMNRLKQKLTTFFSAREKLGTCREFRNIFIFLSA